MLPAMIIGPDSGTTLIDSTNARVAGKITAVVGTEGQRSPEVNKGRAGTAVRRARHRIHRPLPDHSGRFAGRAFAARPERRTWFARPRGAAETPPSSVERRPGHPARDGRVAAMVGPASRDRPGGRLSTPAVQRHNRPPLPGSRAMRHRPQQSGAPSTSEERRCSPNSHHASRSAEVPSRAAVKLRRGSGDRADSRQPVRPECCCGPGGGNTAISRST
jgi:hypothetical protein